MQKLIFTGERINKLPLDHIPFPDIGYDEMGYDEFVAHQHPNYSYWYQNDFPRPYTFVSSRQCPFSCLSGDTLINTVEGMITIKDLVGKKNIGIYAYDLKKKKVFITNMSHCQKTGVNREMIRVNFDDGTHIDCTPDHKFLSFINGGSPNRKENPKTITKAKDLKPKMSVQAIKFYSHPQGYVEVSWGRHKNIQIHRLIAEYKLGRELKKNERVHHMDKDTTNNKPDNIEVCSVGSHWDIHRQDMSKRMKENNPTKNMNQEWRNKIGDSIRGIKRTKEQRKHYSISKLGNKNPMYKEGIKHKKSKSRLEINHKVVSIEKISNADTYNMEVPPTHWFFANNVLVKNCTFCYHSGKFRMRSIDNMIAEMKNAIEKYDANYFYMVDDLWGLTKERLLEFCAKYAELTKGKDIKWLSSLRVNMVDEEIMQAMVKSNCYAIGFGLESMSQTVLDSMNKNITPAMIDRALKLCLKYKINIQGSFIFGDPAETMETAKMTLDYYKDNCQGQPIFEFVKPYPNSPIYQLCLKEGLIKDKMDFVRNLTVMGTYVNMTKMNDRDFNKMRNLVMKTQTQCRKSVTPKFLKKDDKGFYSLEEECPFCGNVHKRGNWDIPNKYLYGFTVVCQKCYMRYYVASPLSLILYRNYHHLYKFRIFKDKAMRKIKLWKNKK